MYVSGLDMLLKEVLLRGGPLGLDFMRCFFINNWYKVEVVRYTFLCYVEILRSVQPMLVNNKDITGIAQRCVSLLVVILLV